MSTTCCRAATGCSHGGPGRSVRALFRRGNAVRRPRNTAFLASGLSPRDVGARSREDR
jgi:hypothetical protein